MKHKLRNLAVSVLALVSTTLAQAQDLTVNGVAETWTGSSSGSVTTSGSTTTIIPATNGNGNTASAGAYFNLGKTITTGSGVWTLNITIDQTGTNAAASNIFAGFGNTVTGSSISGGPGFSGLCEYSINPPTGKPGFGSQGPGWYTSMGVTSGNAGLVDSGYYLPVTYDNGISVFDGSNSQSTPTNYTMVLDTTNAAWTVQFLINGNVQSYIDTKTGLTVDTLTYATDPSNVNEIGVSTFGEGADFTSMTVSETPEPSTYAMLFAGVAMLAFVVRRRSAMNA